MQTFDRRAVLGALGAAGLLAPLTRASRALGGQDAGGLDVDPRAAAALRAVVAQETAFALALHAALTREAPAANAFHSPLSIWTALGMLREGAVGETRAELDAALRVPRTAGGLRLAADPLREGTLALRRALAEAARDVTLSFADALWVDEGFRVHPGTAEALRAVYGAEPAGLDFAGAPDAARARINAWVGERTAGKIDDLLPDGAVTPLTRLVLTDAVHFLGRWRTPFDPTLTREAHFRRPDGSTVPVPFMRLGESAPFPCASFDAAGSPRPLFPPGRGGATWIELPYAGERLSLVAVMPDEHDGLPALERALDAQTLAARCAALRPVTLRVVLPRLAQAPRYDLVPPLRALGVRRAFVAGEADLSGFGAPDEEDARRLYVTGAFHAASLTLDEAGTEAAAATGVVVGVRSAPSFVQLDRPFLFFVRERTSGALLFMGRVTDPSK